MLDAPAFVIDDFNHFKPGRSLCRFLPGYTRLVGHNSWNTWTFVTDLLRTLTNPFIELHSVCLTLYGMVGGVYPVSPGHGYSYTDWDLSCLCWSGWTHRDCVSQYISHLLWGFSHLGKSIFINSNNKPWLSKSVKSGNGFCVSNDSVLMYWSCKSLHAALFKPLQDTFCLSNQEQFPRKHYASVCVKWPGVLVCVFTNRMSSHTTSLCFGLRWKRSPPGVRQRGTGGFWRMKGINIGASGAQASCGEVCLCWGEEWEEGK